MVVMQSRKHIKGALLEQFRASREPKDLIKLGSKALRKITTHIPSTDKNRKLIEETDDKD